ncbi:hypothetical protein H8N00_02590 [Streptomyces sp. AC563]|uniref:hypothetical protein n=1 Tax=Streptomyces buecherae TaxID=2763006 RepID=UPI00164DB877|nr:hypothetical protein [Streptomyces buecherae]MBC3987812.1 hypothetical protein [Streptomyces buecherae]
MAADLTGIADYSNPHPQQGVGHCLVNELPQLVWPYRSELVAWVRWYPDSQFRRADKFSAVPDGAAEHWSECVPRIVSTFEAAGYRVRQPERHQGPSTDEHADLVVYRAKR